MPINISISKTLYQREYEGDRQIKNLDNEMSNNNLRAAEWIDHEDSDNRTDRIARLEWLIELMPQAEYLIFSGGVLSKNLFEELRYGFVYGQFISVIMLCLAYIERILASELYASGRDDLERANINTLLHEALSIGWLTEEEFAQIDKARKIRNAFTHFRHPLHDENIERRALHQDEYPDAIIEDDARIIIQVAFHVLGRFSCSSSNYNLN